VNIQKKGYIMAKKKVNSEANLLGDQDAVMAGYKRSRAVKDKHDEEALHMFFSPNRVPKGLTKKQVRLCINKYPLRKWHRVQTAKTPMQVTGHMLGRPLPDELRYNHLNKMTPARFEAGMKKFNADVISVLAQEINGGMASSTMELGGIAPKND
jgi:hypothetical protein